MKKLLPIIFILIFCSCSSEPEVPSIYLQERGGVYYEVNSTIPFTGKNRTKSEGFGITLIYVDTYKEGLRDGLQTIFRDGKLIEKTHYKDGLKDGLNEEFRKGQLTSRTNYKDGKKHGLEERYYEIGQLKSKVNYLDGNKDGLEETYHENGYLKSKSQFLEGKMNGLSEGYDKNGKFSYKRNYKNDEFHGLIRWNKTFDVDNDESVIGEVCYENGKKVDMSFCEKIVQ